MILLFLLLYFKLININLYQNNILILSFQIIIFSDFCYRSVKINKILIIQIYEINILINKKKKVLKLKSKNKKILKRKKNIKIVKHNNKKKNVK